MDYLEQNRRSWNSGVMAKSEWAQPVSDALIERARAGDWSVVLTPTRPVPRDWFGDVRGKRVLCLASGGGQQVPILAAAGAQVVSFDLSEEQLRRDENVARRHGLHIDCVRGDMADLRALREASFDLVFHPVSNVFARDVRPVWHGCFRALRPGGALLAGFMHPHIFLFDPDREGEPDELLVAFKLPYSDLDQLPPEKLQAKIDEGEPIEFSHSLESQIGGQLEAGFLLAGLYEDRWENVPWALAKVGPVSVATRAVRPA